MKENNMTFSDILQIDNRFEKSVNLLLDLGNPERLKLYIPTRSSVGILKEYLSDMTGTGSERATVLIGPYGKGKSHLLLVLLSILSLDDCTERTELIERIGNISPEAGEDIRRIISEQRPVLPVIINPGTGSLSESFFRALITALKRNGLSDVAPGNYYTEAADTIHRWNEKYPATYEAFCAHPAVKETGIDAFLDKLTGMDQEALHIFKEIYPELTSGGSFSPMLTEDAIDAYRSVNRVLCEKYGYRGIFIIFDEFSKYVEGHLPEGFSADMKTLQDMCELSNSSKEEQIHLTLVAHKAIKTYGNRLPKEVLNAYKGVEGRIREVYFNVSAQNNYELIADAIQKKDVFAEWAENNKAFNEVSRESNALPLFASLFTPEDFKNIVAKGCFPLLPAVSFLTLTLSERVAQNERTLFSFLTDRANGLSSFIAEKTIRFAGADLLYDYFVPIFRDETDEIIHGEWLKADYALTKIENDNAASLIKTLTVVRMVNRPDEFPATEKNLRLASALDDDEFASALALLLSTNLIVLKGRTGAYDFRHSIGVDVEKVIKDCIASRFVNPDVITALNTVLSTKYIAPKKHNQVCSITRYYNTRLMTQESFLALGNYEQLDWNNSPDGAVILVYGPCNIDAVRDHAKELADNRIVVITPKEETDYTDRIKYLLAVKHLAKDASFVEDNAVLQRELIDVENETVRVINETIRKDYFETGIVYTGSGTIQVGSLGLNRTISDICDSLYNKTPVITNELINRHVISPQILKARNAVVEDIINGVNIEKYADGTGPSDTIGRATLIAAAADEGVVNAKKIIKEFILKCEGTTVPFAELITKLTTPPIGMRKGAIPIYLAECLAELEDMPVIYAGNKELTVNAESLGNAVASPDTFNLYIEKETAEKEQYLETMEGIFGDFSNKCRDIDLRSRLARLGCMIQAWYRALPQVSKTFVEADYEGQPVKEAVKFRKLFGGLYLNPREVLFDKVPVVTGAKGDLVQAAKTVAVIKKDTDSHIHLLKKRVELLIREIFGLDSGSDLGMSLKEWYGKQPESVRNSVYGGTAQSFITAIRELNTSDTEEVSGRISRAVIGTFIEDYIDCSIEQFHTELEEIKNIFEKKEQEDGKLNCKVTLTDENGNEETFIYSHDSTDISSTGTFFKASIEDVLEEYGQSISAEEKIGILMDMIGKIRG